MVTVPVFARRTRRGVCSPKTRLQALDFEILPDGDLSIACARFVPSGWSPQAIDDLQTKVAHKISQSGRAWFSTVRHNDRTWLSFRITNLYTAESHIDELAGLVKETLRALVPGC